MPETDQMSRANLIADAALDRKGLSLVALDVSEVTSVADTFVLVTGTSDRHARAITDAIVGALRERGEKPLGVEGYDEGRWVLIDLGDVVVHVFQEDVRAEYDLERLWSDAPTLAIGAAA